MGTPEIFLSPQAYIKLSTYPLKEEAFIYLLNHSNGEILDDPGISQDCDTVNNITAF